MYEKKILLTLDCGLTMTKEVLGGKWKPNLLFAIAEGLNRPSQMQKAIAGATKRVLNLQLKELEEFKVVRKKIYPQLPPKVEYHLTELGESLMPIIVLMNKWGEKNRAVVEKAIARRKKE